MLEVPLHSRKYPGLAALVDDEDYERVNAYRWYPEKHCRPGSSNLNFYAASTQVNGRNTPTRMHKFILGVSGIDHANNDGLDNQRSNLRPATQFQQNGNLRKRTGTYTSQFKGVRLRKGGRWQAGIQRRGRYESLGTFDDEIEAAKAYDAAAVEYFGEFARLNFPVSGLHVGTI